MILEEEKSDVSDVTDGKSKAKKVMSQLMPCIGGKSANDKTKTCEQYLFRVQAFSPFSYCKKQMRTCSTSDLRSCFFH